MSACPNYHVFLTSPTRKFAVAADDILRIEGSLSLEALVYSSDPLFWTSGIDLDFASGNYGLLASAKIFAAPEPATMLLLGSGLIALAGFRRRLKKK